MMRYRNYWAHSVGCFVVWAIVLAVTAATKTSHFADNLLLVFGGWGIAWVSGTIARFAYPPPRRWLEASL